MGLLNYSVLREPMGSPLAHELTAPDKVSEAHQEPLGPLFRESSSAEK